MTTHRPDRDATFADLNAPKGEVEGIASDLFSKDARITELVHRGKELFAELAEVAGYTAAAKIWKSAKIFELAARPKKSGPEGTRDPAAARLLLTLYLRLEACFPDKNRIRFAASLRETGEGVFPQVISGAGFIRPGNSSTRV